MEREAGEWEGRKDQKERMFLIGFYSQIYTNKAELKLIR